MLPLRPVKPATADFGTAAHAHANPIDANAITILLDILTNSSMDTRG